MVQIDDVTRFVKEQRAVIDKKEEESLMVARERVYTEVHPSTAARIGLDYYDMDSLPKVVKGFGGRQLNTDQGNDSILTKETAPEEDSVKQEDKETKAISDEAVGDHTESTTEDLNKSDEAVCDSGEIGLSNVDSWLETDRSVILVNIIFEEYNLCIKMCNKSIKIHTS